ncbi:Membrane protease subunit, stomatin/prohibitin family, contains C-terminal Zn-ribbon domain [Pedobacter westerhofensis]|uniref:Membrane protease subunit, stomatin/prohibitin family, contains C-terminal Zn-ribbon domain n=1 Tax=Pedobacter westerhofensis TaxID=425512 RepID=A0A521FSQ3_9SPHI|nr:SPFH domain-containing protein [Pedobacter westerhofensis]SMO99257.1 Membrane protease subunit, stomatin/prohibitin family, contains C-terminal Zn-ribbon domain [Pedobacter westerhofensis]
MAFTDFLKRQFATVIQWDDQREEVLIQKFYFKGDEIKDASKLIIAPGQGCLLVYEGKVTGLLEQEGIYDLRTDNDPFITTLSKCLQGFESEHKLKIFFYRKASVNNQGWGTSNRVKYQDPVYLFPVSLGVYGNYSFLLTDPRLFLTEIAGLSDRYITTQAQMLIQSRIEQQLTVTLATLGFTILQIDSKLNDLATVLQEQLNDHFTKLGFTLTDFNVQGTSFDEQTQQQINQIGNAQAGSLAANQAGLSYTEMEKLLALRDAARNNNGIMGAGVQMNMGNNSGNELREQDDAIARIKQLKLLLDEGILTEDEFEIKKKQWLYKG